MKDKLFGTLIVASLCACTVNTTKTTSWGKEGVSMLDYQTDSILCATLAERAGVDNGSNTAGGLSGKGTGAASSAPTGGGLSGSQAVGGGGSYRDSAPPDVVSRAATQERARQMQLKQARNDTLHSCLVERGYTEFELTPEQRAELAKLPQGSDARREYLYKLGTDPEVLKAAKAAH